MTQFATAATSRGRAAGHYLQMIRHISLLVIILSNVDSSWQQSQSQSQPPHSHHQHHHKVEQATPKPNPLQNVKILIPNLPPTHYRYYLRNHPIATRVFEDACALAGPTLLTNETDLNKFHQLNANLTFEDTYYFRDPDYGKRIFNEICSKIKHVSKSCWGYENNCQEIYLMPECLGTSNGQARAEQDQKQKQKVAWFSQADFGYVLERVKEMSKYCAADKRAPPEEVSSFECTQNFTTCRGTNLYVQFNISSPSSASSDVDLKATSKIGGWNCDLQKSRIKEEGGRLGRLESWYRDLEGYQKLDDHMKREQACESVHDKQTFFVKVDPKSNLDEYLGVFINLYATIHLNNRFSLDNQIYIWGEPPRTEAFEHLWSAFSQHPPQSINVLNGTRVCFRKFVFAMPPKMVDGLHTDKKLIDGCSKSGLYNAFHKHVMHRLQLPNLYDIDFHRKYAGRLFRVAILSQKSKFMNILNEEELVNKLKSKSFFVQVINYESEDFKKNLIKVLNSDLIIGLHGTGLAYSLFLPDWAGLLELHNFGNERYHNLARLRGVSYFKPDEVQQLAGLIKRVPMPEGSEEWASLNKSRPLDDDKSSNYEVNIDQFMKLFEEAFEKVSKARNEYFLKQAPELVEAHSTATTTTPKSATTTTPKSATTTTPKSATTTTPKSVTTTTPKSATTTTPKSAATTTPKSAATTTTARSVNEKQNAPQTSSPPMRHKTATPDNANRDEL